MFIFEVLLFCSVEIGFFLFFQFKNKSVFFFVVMLYYTGVLKLKLVELVESFRMNQLKNKRFLFSLFEVID